jgi:hypothetical protein
MSGFLDGLRDVLGGFAAVKQIDQDGFDYQPIRDQANWTRDRTRQVAQQADETRDLGMAEDALVGGGSEQDIQPFLQSVDPSRRGAIDALLKGRAGERKSALASRKAYDDLALQQLRGTQRRGDIEAQGENAIELAQAREKLRAGQPLSPRERAMLESAEKRARMTQEGANYRAANFGSGAGFTKVGGQNEGQAGTWLYPKNGGPPQFVPSAATAGTRGKEEAKGAALKAYNSLMGIYDTMGGQPEGGITARATGFARSGKAALGYAPQVEAFKSGVRGFVPLMARALGHVGVLTELDVERTEQLFPGPGSTAEEKALKMRLIEDIMSGNAPMPFQLGQGGGKPVAYIDENGEMHEMGGGQRQPSAAPQRPPQAPQGGASHGPAVKQRRLPNGSVQYRDAQGNIWSE